MEEISSIIKAHRKLKGLTQQQLADKVGKSYQLIQKWESGKGQPTASQLRVVSQVLDIPIGVLLGLEYTTDSEETTEGSIILTSQVRPNPSANSFVEVPYLSAKAQAGPAQLILNDCETFVSETYPVLSTLIEKRRKYMVIMLTGSSMEPVLQSGSIVLAQLVEPTDIPYESGAVYAVRYADRLVIKRIRTNEIRTKGSITLHSDNEIYGQIIVPVDELQCLWRVKCLVYQSVQ